MYVCIYLHDKKMMLSVVSDFFVSEKSSYCDAWISNSVPIRLPYKIRSPRSRLHVPKPS